MRPVLLQMHGFASYREPATVDFSDVDYFALVGPTGSGKSTVIDGMTFALYGTVPRWDDRRTVRWALAPTSSFGTVRLVFDLGTERFVVARELRRSKQGVNVKNARLERLVDAASTGEVDDATEVLASDSEVSPYVERLLGLSFDNFCQCVVLPQGEFAEFLHAKPSERQKILLKLLGADKYESVRERAARRAAAAGDRADVLAGQLARYGDVTDDAETAAVARVAQVERLQAAVSAALPEMQSLQQAVQQCEVALRALQSEQALLDAVQLPAGVAALDEAQARAVAALAEAGAVEKRAQQAESAARAAVAAGPDRAPLQLAQSHHAERAEVTASLPALDDVVADAERKLGVLGDATAGLVTAEEEARAHKAAAELAVGEAAQEVASLRDQRERLSSLQVPPDVGQLHAKLEAARDAVGRCAEAVAAATEADDDARAALDSAPARAPLERALADLTELAERKASLPAAEQADAEGVAAAASAREQVEVAERALAAARAHREAMLVTNGAAALRPHLAEGEECPVCEQPVQTLPAPLPSVALEEAEAAVQAADQRLRTARTQEQQRVGSAAQSSAALVSLTARIEDLRTSLEGQPDDPAVLRAALQQLDTAAQAAADAHSSRQQAVAALDTANSAKVVAERQADGARQALRVARDAVVPLGAPPVDDTDLLAGWTTLHGWAAGRLRALVPQEKKATELEAAQQQALSEATARHSTARADVAEHQQRLQAAAGEHASAQASAAAARDRLVQLGALLSDAPESAEVDRLLGECDRLEAAAEQAHTELGTAREARETAAAELTEKDAAVEAARRALRSARDPLVPLGAPDVEGARLLPAWTTLLAWVQAQAEERRASLASAHDAVGTARDAADTALVEVHRQLEEAALPVPAGEPATVIPAAVATVVEQARAARRRLAERRAEAAGLAADRDAAVSEQQVANLLANLLRATGFPQWLAGSALDALVVDASAGLAELSGGQFELTHEKGDFVVVDHADADSRRSVRTLSGGETFQASLALALALSRQMTALSAAGAAKLDSIFLDEGFGTLDESSLDVVAGTLESLADGDRMVGVITHVPALAERVPVRFAVHRDSRSSYVTRETA